MTRKLPPLNALRAFEAAARHASITRAADELFVTHGAVSRQIKGLEEALGVALFRRANRQISLTPAGERLLPTATAAFDLLAAGVAQVAGRDQRGPLQLSCMATFTMRWLIPRLHRLSAQHPEVEVRLSTSDMPVDFNLEGFDLAIRIGAPPWPDDMNVTPFLSERIGPVLSPKLLAESGLERPEHLADLPLLHTNTRPTAWPDWLGANGIGCVDAEAGQRLEHFFFMLQAAASGLGVAIGPEPLAADDIEAGRLVAPFGFIDTGRSYTLLSTKAMANRADIAAFRDWLLAEAGANADQS